MTLQSIGFKLFAKKWEEVVLFVVQVVLVLTLQATLSENFIAFLESTLNFEHFKKKKWAS